MSKLLPVKYDNQFWYHMYITNTFDDLTKYLKEKASIYFALYHELGHVRKDYNRAKSKVITYLDEVEDEADRFALEQMIPNDIYCSIMNNFKDRDNICKDNNIPLCFLYSRFAYEGIICYGSDEYQKHRETIE